MPRLWKHRPSPAMIVALLALFVAMGGTGYAVSKLPKRSVGPAQLRRDAVRARHIKAGAITTAKLAKTTLSSLRAPVAAPGVGAAPGAAAATAGPGPGADPAGHVAYADKAGFADRAALADRATAADSAGAADTAAVADSAKLAANASKLGGMSVAEFLTADTIRWVSPFTIGPGTREVLKVGPFTLTARCVLNARIGGVDGQDQADIVISTTQPKSAFDGDDLLGSLDPGDDVETRQFVNTVVTAHGAPRFEASSDGVAIGGDGVVYIKGSYLFAAMNVAGQPGKCKFGGYLFL